MTRFSLLATSLAAILTALSPLPVRSSDAVTGDPASGSINLFPTAAPPAAETNPADSVANFPTITIPESVWPFNT